MDVPTLLDWTPDPWKNSELDLRDAADIAKNKVHEIREEAEQTARKMRPIGKIIARNLEQKALAQDEFADRLINAYGIVQHGRQQVESIKASFVPSVAKVDAQAPKITRDDQGYCESTVRPKTNDPAELEYARRMWLLALQYTQLLRELLIRAEQSDNQMAKGLYGLLGLDFPTARDGWLDLSDAGIAYQAALNNQAGYGDCVTLSTLLSIANSDPSFIRKHMKWNADDQCYEVALYGEDGKKRTVRVYQEDLDALAWTDKEGNDRTGSSFPGSKQHSFMSVYEAAIAKEFGHEDLAKGKSTDFAIERITGKSADRTVPPPSFEQVKETLDRRPPGLVVVGSGGRDPVDMGSVDPSKRIVEAHAYSVKGFDDQGRIVVVNPWGPGGGWVDGHYYPGEIHLTEEEYNKFFHSGAAKDKYQGIF